MIDWTKPVRTKGGIPVEIISTEGRGAWPILGYIGEKEEISFWDGSGKSRGIYDHEFDALALENAPQPVKTQEVWVSVFMDVDGSIYCTESSPRKDWAFPLSDDLVGRNKIILRTEFDE